MTTSHAFTLALPAGLKLLNANQRIHHRVRADLTSALRGAAGRPTHSVVEWRLDAYGKRVAS